VDRNFLNSLFLSEPNHYGKVFLKTRIDSHFINWLNQKTLSGIKKNHRSHRGSFETFCHSFRFLDMFIYIYKIYTKDIEKYNFDNKH